MCRSGCPTPGAHASWGDCLRSAHLRIGQVDATEQKAWDRELDEFRSAVRQGVHPAGTKLPQIRDAMAISEATGTPFRADEGAAS